MHKKIFLRQFINIKIYIILTKLSKFGSLLKTCIKKMSGVRSIAIISVRTTICTS